MKLGILGGGQLGRMMMPSLRELHVQHAVLDPDPDCSCAKVADAHIIGNFRNYDDVIRFGQIVDTLTIEIEQVNVDALEDLTKQGKKIFPPPAMIRVIQDKHEQKKFFQKHHIPTSAFRFIQNYEDLRQHENFLPFAQKACTGGYDGQGVMLHRTAQTLTAGLKTPSIIEQLVDIDQELSVIVARNQSGEIKNFPTVGQRFDPEANLVKFVYAPADISAEIDQTCQQIATDLAEKFNLVGLLAVEFFLDKTGQILVNEVAPRCHNSGHWTQNGCATSQFEQLVRAVTNRPLGATDITKPTVMVNLLGPKNYTGEPKQDFFDEVLAIPDTHIHWYGKKESKPMRKLGHINVCGRTIEEAKKKAERVYKIANKTHFEV